MRRRVSVFELLESRCLLNGQPAAALHPTYVIHRNDGSATPYAASAPTGLTPTQIRHAYGFDQITFGGVQGDGTGQTIAIIDAYDAPTIASDLVKFDLQFGIADPPSFTRVAQNGTTNYPSTDPAGAGNNTWETETALDVEWAHALAPQASILLVEANSPTDSDLLSAAVSYARSQPGVAAISMSFGGGESSSDTNFNSIFTTPSGHTGVTFLASTGDNGKPGGYPSYSPNVVAVGGTTLSVDGSDNYLGEIGWSGSGGGVSTIESQSAYQNGVVSQFSTSKRTTPDVAFDADPSSGVPLYDSWDFGPSTPWLQIGGTSFSCPAWAALIAVADQMRAAAGQTALDGPSQTLPKLYALPGTDFNDITSGNNGFSAGPGYDLVTGRGSPKAPMIATDLVDAYSVVSSTPASGSSVAMPPTDFTITLPTAYAASGVAANLLTVNGIAADSFTLTNSTTITFHYNVSPVTAQGLETMSIAAGAVARQVDGAPLAAFSASFRYDVLPIAVASLTPANNSTVALPLTTLTAHFNEAYAPASISTSNLSLSEGSVSSFTLIDPQTVAYNLIGINSAGTLTINMTAAAVTDIFGNPGPAYSGSLILTPGPVPFPTPLSAVAPAGSLIYRSSTAGSIAAGSTDTYTLSVAAGQTLTVLVTPTSSLRAQLNLTGPGVSASTSSASAGAPAVLQTVAIGTTGTYTFTVNELNSTTGSYAIQADLNTALSTATVGGASNHTLVTAQSLDSSFVTLSGTANRGAAMGTLATSIGPDGFGYGCISIAPQFVDISPSGPSPTANAPILVGADDGYLQLTSANLAGFHFKLYNTTYSSVFVSTNGLLTFGSGSAQYLNTDLTSVPSQAAIAPLWDDLVVTGASQSGVYWQVQGTGSAQRLVVQWNEVSFFGGAQTGPATFEAILNADGTIIANYKNLNSGDSSAGGASASAGIKDSGTQGSNRLLVSLNSASGPYVATGKSLEIGDGLASLTTDYYAYTLAAGQATTLALAGQKSSVSVSLQNAQGSTLAAGASPGGGSDVTSAINNFVAPAAGTYYAVVTGTAGASYSLVVNRDADFGAETNGSFATAQNISGTKGILGDILAPPAAPTENWYSVGLTAGSAIVLRTFTPGGASAQFVNDLAPQVQLYSPTDVLVASGQGPGNQTLSAAVATTGAYRIRVLANNSTSGEYFLSAVIDASPPTVAIAAVSPSPRNNPVSQVQVAFNKPVSGVSLANFSLTANGGPNLLTASQSLMTSDNITYVLGNLAPLTNADGAYTLSLGASPTIVDSSGGFLASGAMTSFVVDMTPPTVAITPISPNPRNSALTQMQIVFSEPVTGFTLASLSLTAGGGPNLLAASQTLTTTDNATFVLSNLASLTTASSTYTLNLTAAGSGIVDAAGNPLAANAAASFIVDVTRPTVAITLVSPNPRNLAVAQMQIVFSEPVTGFTLASLSLTAGGGPNLLTASQNVTTSDNTTFTLGNLTSLTGSSGIYSLALTAAGSGITDVAGNPLAADAAASFVVDVTPPSVAITPVSPNPRNSAVTQMQIVFSEPVSGFTLAALLLTDNGGPNLLTASQTLTTSDNTTFTLGDLAGLTDTVGTYNLNLNAGGSGIIDQAGNPLANSVSASFVVNVPAQITNTLDSGPGSLRQALLDASGAPGLTHTLKFELPAGPQSISLLTPLPVMTDPLIAFLDPTQNVTISSSSASGWDNYIALTKTGAGTLTISEANRFNGSLLVEDGALRLNDPLTPTFAAGVGITVTGAGTLELASSVSDLTSRVNVSNSSTAAAGILVSGRNQVVGGISGAGNLAVNAGSDATANSVQQDTLVIGGTATSFATLIIAPSDANGNPLATAAPASGMSAVAADSSGLPSAPVSESTNPTETSVVTALSTAPKSSNVMTVTTAALSPRSFFLAADSGLIEFVEVRSLPRAYPLAPKFATRHPLDLGFATLAFDQIPGPAVGRVSGDVSTFLSRTCGSESSTVTQHGGAGSDPQRSLSHAGRFTVLSPVGTLASPTVSRSGIIAATGDLDAQLHDLVVEELAKRNLAPFKRFADIVALPDSERLTRTR